MRRKNATPTVRKSPLVAQLEAEIVKRESESLKESFKAFVMAAWDIIEPGVPFVDGMHIDAIAAHLEACADRRIKKLLINIPPRFSKSSLVSVLYPAWLWTRRPNERFLCASYDKDLSTRDSTKMRRVVESEWYRRRWPFLQLAPDQNLKTSFENTLTGGRQITSTGGATTGLGGSHLLLDDPHNVQKTDSAAIREAAVTWFRESWSTRANSADAVRIVIMQRIHQRDVSAYCLEEGNWEHLCLPMEFEGSKKTTVIGWSDPRTEFGDLLCPARFDAEGTKNLKVTMGEYAYAGQFQQRPAPRGGGIIKKEWLRFWYDEDRGIPEPEMVQTADGLQVEAMQRALPRLDETTRLCSWDLAFKGGERNDFVVGQAWARGDRDNRGNLYLLDQERGNFDFPSTLAAVRRLADRQPSFTTLVEEKANGAAVIASLHNEVTGMVAVQPQGGKEARCAAVAPLFEAGNVWLPHPEQFPWVASLIEELTTFPRAAHDDQVDALTQALTRMMVKQESVIDLGFNAAEAVSLLRSNPWVN